MSDKNIIYKIHVDTETATASIKRLNGTVVAGAVPIEKLRKEFGNLATKVDAVRFDKFNKQLKSATTNNASLARASGGATTSVLELGRVVSDAPYGIRGMANNVSQLASNMLFTAQQVDKTTGKVIGFSGVLKQMGRTFLGPLGVLFAIQAVVSALDYFYGGMKKSTDEANEFNDALELMKIKMDLIAETMPSVADDIDKMLGILKDEDVVKLEDIIFSSNLKDNIKILKSEFKDFATYYDNLTSTQQKDKSFMEGTIRKYQELLATRKTVSEQEKKILELTKKERENPNLIIAWEKIRSDYKKALLAKIDLEAFFKDKRKKKKTKEVKKKEKKKFILKDPKDFDKELKTLEGMAIKYYQKSLVKQSENGLDKLKAEKSNEEDRLKALKVANEKRFDEQAEAAKKEYNTYLKLQVAKGNITEIERQKKQVVFDDSIDLDVAKQKKAAKETYDRAVKALNFLYDGLFKAEKKKQEDKKKRGDLAIYKDRLDAMRAYASEAKKILSSVTGFIDGEYDRELAIEKNKTNAINNELNQRLLNESLSKTQRQNIQNQIAQNDEALRKKQEAIERKKFEMNKAANIAGATIDTFRAAAGVLKDTKGGSFARIAGMIAVIGAGLAQVTAISRQKFVSSAGAKNPILSGSAGSSGGADRSFNFNLVGNTQANQIADAIQGRFKQPLKAFVVSRDITTQQELDANIKGSASF